MSPQAFPTDETPQPESPHSPPSPIPAREIGFEGLPHHEFRAFLTGVAGGMVAKNIMSMGVTPAVLSSMSAQDMTAFGMSLSDADLLVSRVQAVSEGVAQGHTVRDTK
ncbi:hypothetical protein KIPB_003797 [Kipferlia bialata]|uniref:Uncharacterized protein n=1 Tax=Kipferlia bialata TaxID=797122 RepID=A0A9K3CSQ9_9EUKA|nr:hypothetical protein KIPB_003797 [Kipferlia bialata]|eukprot:g3797.t1